MVKLCIKLYANGNSTADNVATTVIPVSATLVAVSWASNVVNAGAVGSSVWFQLSQMSTSSWTSNDARGIIAEFIAGSDKAINFNGNQNHIQPIGGLKFAAGDIIRLHRSALVAPTTCYLLCNLHLV